jgi:acyl-CoA thioester hydrolase
MDVKIYYEDTDCGGVVYHANYLKYFERARTQFLEDRDISVAEMVRDGTQFMVVRAEINYRAPAFLGQVLSIETRVPERKKSALTFAHTVRERSSGRLLVEGSATLVAVDLQGRLKRLPAPLLAMPLGSPARRVAKRRPPSRGRIAAGESGVSRV